MPHKTGRKFQQSHPWIRFELDLARADARLWLALGQAVSLCEQVAASPLPPINAREMHRHYLAKGARSTTAIEGNTLSEEQVREQVEGRLKLPPSQEYLQREVQNILDAYGDIWNAAQKGALPALSPQLVFSYNRSVLAGLEGHLEDGVIPGEISRHGVVVGRYRGAPREDCLYLLQRLCNWLESFEPPQFRGIGASRLVRAIFQALLAHLYIAWIHPFGDGNGRTARFLEYMLLVRAGVPAPSAHLLSNHYNATRAEYYRQLAQSSQVNSGRGDICGFLRYAIEGFADGLQEQCNYIDEVRLEIAWRSFISGHFQSLPSSGAMQRRQAIARALSAARAPLRKGQIADLSPQLARLYARKTEKTLSRDLNWLVEQDLIAREPTGYRAKTERILSFLPPQVR